MHELDGAPGTDEVDVEHLVGRLGLHHHHRHCVRDGVVQLPRNPGPLVCGRCMDPFLAIRFGLLGPRAQLGDVQAASAQEGSEEQKQQPDDADAAQE